MFEVCLLQLSPTLPNLRLHSDLYEQNCGATDNTRPILNLRMPHLNGQMYLQPQGLIRRWSGQAESAHLKWGMCG
jgi:hypothetical protein